MKPKPKRYTYRLQAVRSFGMSSGQYHIRLMGRNGEVVMFGENKDSRHDCLVLIDRILNGRISVDARTQKLIEKHAK